MSPFITRTTPSSKIVLGLKLTTTSAKHSKQLVKQTQRPYSTTMTTNMPLKRALTQASTIEYSSLSRISGIETVELMVLGSKAMWMSLSRTVILIQCTTQ
jgi:hypothetical protein